MITHRCVAARIAPNATPTLPQGKVCYYFALGEDLYYPPVQQLIILNFVCILYIIILIAHAITSKLPFSGAQRAPGAP